MSHLARLRILASLVSFILVLDLAPSAICQIAGGMTETTATRFGGTNYLAGTVFWPTGQPVNVRMSIRLSSQITGDVLASTDDRGQFVFSGLTAGDYTIVIDGEKDYVPVAQHIAIIESRTRIKETYNMSIRLVEKVKPTTKPAVIDQVNLGIPKRATELYRKALDLSGANDHKGAIAQLKLAIAEYPEFLNAYNELGVQYLKTNELDKADEALVAALKIKPDAVDPLLNRGIVLFRTSRFAEAETVLSYALKLKDQSAVGHFYRGRTLAKLQRYSEAEKDLYSSIAMDGDGMKEAHRMLAMMFIDRDDYARAIDELETYLRLVPNAPDAGKLKQAVVQLKTQTGPPAAKPMF